MLSAVLAMLMQVGPNPVAGGITAVPPELDELRRRQKTQIEEVTAAPDRLQSCLSRVEQDSTAAATEAAARLEKATGIERAYAYHCLGYSQASLSRWSDAARNFLAARDVGPQVDAKYRARLGAIAANALLSAGNNIEAITVLEQAQRDAEASGFKALGAEIELDRARALVATGQAESAGTALAKARELAPRNARAWLLSATLARRGDDLSAAQEFIQQANLLDPANPDIGLEAGVIAVLLGNDAAARRSWLSVETIAPDTPQAQTASKYLEQLAAQ